MVTAEKGSVIRPNSTIKFALISIFELVQMGGFLGSISIYLSVGAFALAMPSQLLNNEVVVIALGGLPTAGIVVKIFEGDTR